MKTLSFRVRFLTPAFLGDAEQKGAWRVPPFKAQLRYWWRFVYAAEHGFDVDIAAMRVAEGDLFGEASSAKGHASKVRMRLNQWRKGRLDSWDPLPRVRHPEVKVRDKKAGKIKEIKIGSDLYLGFGPLSYKRREGLVLEMRNPIEPGESMQIMIACSNCSEEQKEQLEKAVVLMDKFGQVGGRSRNGWGSFILESEQPGFELGSFVRDWREALAQEWPHAIGQDERGVLIWETQPFETWQDLMYEFAKLKVKLRTSFPFRHGSVNEPEIRHWLSYPVTNHPVKPWNKKKYRIPNTLRFKVVDAGDGKAKGRLFHTPCRPVFSKDDDLNDIENLWKTVYQLLDSEKTLKRVDQV